MKKILMVNFSLYNGGAERSLVNLLNEIEEGKYQIDLLLIVRDGLFFKQVPDWVNIIETPDEILDLYGGISNSRHSWRTRIRRYYATFLSRLLCKTRNESEAFRWKHFYKKVIPYIEGEYDLAVAYVSGDPMFIVSDRVHASKKVLWVHNDYRAANFPKKYDEEHYRKMDAIVSISDKCVDILKEEFPELADKMCMIPNITSSQVVRKRAAEFFPPEFEGKENIILSIGRLCEQKGFDMAITAAYELKQRNVSFSWFIIGDGKDYQKLEKQIGELELKNEVYLLGARDNPYPYIQNCTVFAQTSRFEGKSVVLDEAKILATPILVTDYPTVHDQIKGQKEGLIVAIDSAAIAEGIEMLLSRNEIRESITNYLSAHEYGNQDVIEQYYRVLDI